MNLTEAAGRYRAAVIAAHNAAARSRLTRDAAQDAGWAVRRNHGGRDLCPAHHIEAAA